MITCRRVWQPGRHGKTITLETIQIFSWLIQITLDEISRNIDQRTVYKIFVEVKCFFTLTHIKQKPICGVQSHMVTNLHGEKHNLSTGGNKG